LQFHVAVVLEPLVRLCPGRRECDRVFLPTLEPAIAQLHQVWNNFFKRE
jgi:hypothetical protein